MPEDHKFHDLSVSLIGTISTKLRDLKGIRTLANELIQNADDAENATIITFNLCDDALYVYNDGLFRDIDFERLKIIASGGKRDEEGTIGAFGVGFLSVYQITDAPEVISNGKHWIIEPHKKKEQIKERDAGETSGTLFRLPWAYNPDSTMRKELREQIVSKENFDEWIDDLKEALPNTLLFLNKLDKIMLYRNDHELLSIERIASANQILVSVNKDIQTWHIYEGSFKEVENKLRQKYFTQIEQKRSSIITIAVSDSVNEKGYICASLPTQMRTNLPIQINADFFPTSDRKSIVLESDYQSEWNRAAIECAAKTLTDHFEEIKLAINYKNIWALIQSTYDLNKKANQDEVDSVFKCFWEYLHPVLASLSVFYTCNDDWVSASEVKLLEKETENNAIPLLIETEINILHPHLKRYHNLMRELKVSYLEIWDIISLLQNEGLTKPFTGESLPQWLKKPGNLELLWKECDTLLENQRVASQYERAKEELAFCTLVPGTDGLFHPANEVFKANTKTVVLFASIPSCIFIQLNESLSNKLFEILCVEFTPQIAIIKISEFLSKDLNFKWLDEYAVPFLKWFEQYFYSHGEDLIIQLPDLPIYPATTGEYFPLNKLSLPGDFNDPLNLTNIIDTKACEEVIDFINILGVKELTFVDYLQSHILPALEDETLQEDQIKSFIHILAMKLEMIKDNKTLRDRLMGYPLVLNTSGKMNPAKETYFPTNVILDILSSDASIAKVPTTNTEKYQDLYLWLGVAHTPHPVDVLKKIRTLTEKHVNEKSKRSIEAIIKHLTGLYQKQKFNEDEWSELKKLEWLPVKNQKKWYKPQEAYTTFQEYLFSTQGLFVSITRTTQTEGNKILEHFGVKSTPTTSQVVDHLIMMAELNEPVHSEVYSYLNYRYEEPEIKTLISKDCILLDGNYYSPNQVFWNEHPFGKRRLILGSELRKYYNLLTELGVKDKPNFEDAILVLRELSEEYGSKNKVICEEIHNITISCWKLLSEEAESDEVNNQIKTLSSDSVIPNKQNLLHRPAQLFFTDPSIIQPNILHFLQYNLIDKIHGAWQAMHIAGVLPIKEKMKIDIIELDNPTPCVMISDLINSRINQLIRCIDGMQSVTKSREEIHRTLIEMDYFKVQNLELEWSITIGSQTQAEHGMVSAFFCEDDHCIYHNFNKNSTPWSAIAREIAISINTGDDIGQIAIGIKEVLKADNPKDAELSLDELGYPRIQIIDTATPTETAIKIGSLEIGENSEKIMDLHYKDKEPIDKDILHDQSKALEKVEIKKPNTMKSKAPTQKKSRLRTYVISEYAHTEKKMSADEINMRKQLDKAGIEKVVEFEKLEGRKPEVMDHHNPGYDIISHDLITKGKRYIEVKSISNTWERNDVGLTSKQFMEALKLNVRFWLYVVEQPDSTDYKIYTIKDPANKVDQFLYDGGWQAISESIED